MNANTPKLESCRGVSVSFFTTWPLSCLEAFGRGRSSGQLRGVIMYGVTCIMAFLCFFSFSGGIIPVTCFYTAPFSSPHLRSYFSESSQSKKTFNLNTHLAEKRLLGWTCAPGRRSDFSSKVVLVHSTFWYRRTKVFFQSWTAATRSVSFQSS